MSCGDEKVDSDSLGRGTWKVKTSDISKLINSNNSSKQLVSSLIFNTKTKIATRITLQARPADKGRVYLYFNCSPSRSGTAFHLKIVCKPHFDKSNNESSSVSITLDKSPLLSSDTISFVYAIKSPKTRCFVTDVSHSGYNQNYSLAPTRSPHYKPIPFECSFDASILSELDTMSQSKAARYNPNSKAAHALTSIHDAATNTMWLLFLNQDRYIVIQPVTSKADRITSWIEIQCPDVLFYRLRYKSFVQKKYGLSAENIVKLTEISHFDISHEKVITVKGNIFPTKWERKIADGRGNHMDITPEIYAASAMDMDKKEEPRLVMKKMKEMAVHIQTLNVGLNNLLKVNKELANDNRTLKEMVCEMKVTLDNKVDKREKSNASNLKKVNESGTDNRDMMSGENKWRKWRKQTL